MVPDCKVPFVIGSLKWIVIIWILKTNNAG